MTEIARILDQLQRTFEGDAWHGDNVMKLLQGVTAEQAAGKSVSHAHSIWELVVHMTAWKRIARERIEGNVREISDAEDWQAVTDTSPGAWERTVQALVQAHRKLYEVVARLDESLLNEKIRKLTYYVQIHGIIQHDLYHAGQIAVLKKSFA